MFRNTVKKLTAGLCMAAMAFSLTSPVAVNAKGAELNLNDFIIESQQPISSDYLMESKFASGGPTHTHQYVISQALAVLENDKGSSLLNSTNNALTLMTYTDWPDKFGKETDYTTFAGHFYNPHTGKNWMGAKSPTALSRATSHYEDAVKAYKAGNVEEALQALGKGTHYVADLNEPHHASNLTAVNSNHSKFEKYVDENRTSFYIAGNTLAKSYYKEAQKKSVEEILKAGAFYAYDLKEMAQDKDTYYEAANLSVQHAIINETQYIYAFGVEVGIFK